MTATRRAKPPTPIAMQGKPAEYVPARDLRDDDIIARPGKPEAEGRALGQRLEAVVIDGGEVRAKAKGTEKWYRFGADEPVLRRVTPPRGGR